MPKTTIQSWSSKVEVLYSRAAWSRRVLYKIDGIKTSVRKWIMTPRAGPVLWKNYLKTSRSRYRSGHQQALTLSHLQICGKGWKNPTILTPFQQFYQDGNGQKLLQLVVRNLRKATQNIWPNCLHGFPWETNQEPLMWDRLKMFWTSAAITNSA